MVNVSIASDRMNVFVKMDGRAKIAKKKWKCVQWQRVKMMPTVSICSKTISVFVQRELTENNVKLHQNVALEIHVRISRVKFIERKIIYGIFI